jgi:hypothetical protein
MARLKQTRVYLPVFTPADMGLEGDPLEFRIWANPDQATRDAVWDSFTDAGKVARAKAFHDLFGTSEPQTLEIEDEDGSVREVVLDFRTVDAARATIEQDLPDDFAIWLTNLPSHAITKRREKIAEYLPFSFDTPKS